MFALSVHESAHAFIADRFGDPTARRLGRITLNPVPHIDLVGTIIFPIMLALLGAPVFGWAKPVPVNIYNLRPRRRGHFFVSAAGPISNIIMAGLGILLFLVFKPTGAVNLAFPLEQSGPIALILFFLIIINIYLAVFNLIPIPPLDGSGILESTLKGNALYQYQKLKPYGFIFLLLIIYTDILDKIAFPIIRGVFRILGY